LKLAGVMSDVFGVSGMLMLRPYIMASGKDIWQLKLLEGR